MEKKFTLEVIENKFHVIREGNKRATRVFYTEEEAVEFIKLKTKLQKTIEAAESQPTNCHITISTDAGTTIYRDSDHKEKCCGNRGGNCGCGSKEINDAETLELKLMSKPEKLAFWEKILNLFSRRK